MSRSCIRQSGLTLLSSDQATREDNKTPNMLISPLKKIESSLLSLSAPEGYTALTCRVQLTSTEWMAVHLRAKRNGVDGFICIFALRADARDVPIKITSGQQEVQLLMDTSAAGVIQTFYNTWWPDDSLVCGWGDTPSFIKIVAD